MNFGRRQRSSHGMMVELTPMIDVVFLLIIFFLTTARFARDTREDLDLPREAGEQQETTEEAGIVVNVRADGAIVIDQTEFTLDELETHVRSEVARTRGNPEQIKLLLRADRGGSSQRLNEIVQRLQTVGVGAARLATEIP